MQRTTMIRPLLLFVLVLWTTVSFGQSLSLKNSTISANFNATGLVLVQDASSGSLTRFAKDDWSLTIEGKTLQSGDVVPTTRKLSNESITYDYEFSGFEIEVTYRLHSGWNFVTKQIAVLKAPSARFTVQRVVLWDVALQEEIASDYVPSTYAPQFGATIEKSREHLPGKDYGVFLRFAGQQGAMLNVQNPYLEVERDGQSVVISYSPEMDWDQAWGSFQSDAGCAGVYRLTGRRFAREMVKEWQPAPAQRPEDGMDEAEVAAYKASVRAFLIDASPSPISVEVGWTLNDYQIDAGTEEGRAEYKRIIDTASDLGIQTLLYAPGDSQVSDRTKSADTWSWEYVLWLGLGQKIRNGEWRPGQDPIPSSIASMLDYAKQKHVGLLAYVYPSIPYAEDASWLVGRANDRETVPGTGSPPVYATLASRAFQDYLLHNLVSFQKQTGIAGYSFDYTFLDLPGSSSYAQWFGWRRVIEALRNAVPGIVIDGRQTYQLYGPWSWLAGSYPHPTGNDEQPESFKPFPDLHFDRVSADRARFVNYWYRNYQFAPEQVIPGYATHQTERSRDVVGADGQHSAEMMYTGYRTRDWDYLGFKYSFISSIATGGWNNVVDMIPARDPEEFRDFSAEDKAWIRNWLAWTIKHREYLLHARSILQQPALGHVDGIAAVVGDHGFIFLFNPNYKHLTAHFVLDATIGLSQGAQFLLREVYPQRGRLLGKPGAGGWTRGDTVDLPLDGTSATVLELKPLEKVSEPLIFNGTSMTSSSEQVSLVGSKLQIAGLAGEPGTSRSIGVLLPHEAKINAVQVNGQVRMFHQSGNYIELSVTFAGIRFAQAEQIQTTENGDGILTGTLVVPQRVFDQLEARKKLWPIDWTQEDYQTTWLSPERLLLYVQFANPKDTLPVTAMLDGQPLSLTPAYSSIRVDAPCFVGFYADLSKIKPDVRHTIELRIPSQSLGLFQGIFFDNVLPQFTQKLEPAARSTR